MADDLKRNFEVDFQRFFKRPLGDYQNDLGALPHDLNRLACSFGGYSRRYEDLYKKALETGDTHNAERYLKLKMQCQDHKEFLYEFSTWLWQTAKTVNVRPPPPPKE